MIKGDVDAIIIVAIIVASLLSLRCSSGISECAPSNVHVRFTTSTKSFAKKIIAGDYFLEKLIRNM